MIYAMIAFIAGIMKELNKIEGKGFSFRRLLESGAISSFVGITLSFLLAHFGVKFYLSAFCISVAGWLGGNLMNYLGLAAKKFTNKKLEINITTEEEKSHSDLIN